MAMFSPEWMTRLASSFSFPADTEEESREEEEDGVQTRTYLFEDGRSVGKCCWKFTQKITSLLHIHLDSRSLSLPETTFTQTLPSISPSLSPILNVPFDHTPTTPTPPLQ